MANLKYSSNYNPANVAISGGGINGTTLGIITPAAVAATTLSVSGAITGGTDLTLNRTGVGSTLSSTDALTISAATGKLLKLQIAATDVAIVSSTGLAVTGDVTANGLTFPATQVDSANANTLDDYEEGSWTPAIYYGATLAGIYNVGGTYTKVGRLVTCYMSAYINHGAGALRIEGLPFAAANGTQPNGWFGSSARDVVAGVSSTGAVGVGSASCNFDYSFAGLADCDIRACIVYQV